MAYESQTKVMYSATEKNVTFFSLQGPPAEIFKFVEQIWFKFKTEVFFG